MCRGKYFQINTFWLCICCLLWRPSHQENMYTQTSTQRKGANLYHFIFFQGQNVIKVIKSVRAICQHTMFTACGL